LDGAGPEHSSSRIERMLQLTNDPYDFTEGNRQANVNMHIAFPTNPAQYFHLLRRQMKRNYRKPLIVASPKGLLRLPAASSSLASLEHATSFQPILDDSNVAKLDVRRVVLLSGKLYYDVIKERQRRQLSTVAFVRIEELCPFPFEDLLQVLSGYVNIEDIIWLQEEPRNQGAWAHMEKRINAVLSHLGHASGKIVSYRGRKEDSVPAPGGGRLYAVQQNVVIEAAFEGL